MKPLLLNWSWLACLLVASQLPVLFLDQNIREIPSRRMIGFLGRERFVERATGAVMASGIAALVLVLIFAGWKAALFVGVANMIGLIVDRWIAYALGLLDQPVYSFRVGPILWGILCLALLIVRICF